MNHFNEDILHLILMRDSLSVKDILSFISQCRYYRSVMCKSKSLWALLMQKRWPSIYERFNAEIEDFFEEVLLMGKLEQQVSRLLENLSEWCFSTNRNPEERIDEWIELSKSSERARHYVLQFLLDKIHVKCSCREYNESDPTPFHDHTTIHLAHQIYRYLYQSLLLEQYEQFCKLDPEEQLLEDGMSILTKWCQIFQNLPVKAFTEREMDILVRDVIEAATYNCNHPIKDIGEEVLQFWKKHNIRDTHWSSSDCKTLLLNGLVPVFEMFLVCSTFMEFGFVDQVALFKQGFWWVVNIVIAVVARRVGIKCFFKSNMRLIICAGENFFSTTYSRRIGAVSFKRIRSSSLVNSTSLPTIKEIIQKAAELLVKQCDPSKECKMNWCDRRSTLEMLFLVKSRHRRCLQILGHFYVTKRLYNKPILDYLSSQLSQDYSTYSKYTSFKIPAEPQRRTAEGPNPKFVVGMTVTDAESNVRWIICGWNWNEETKNYIYDVMNRDGAISLRIREDMLLETGLWANIDFDDGDLGKFFSRSIWDTYVIPNKHLLRLYPDDIHILEDMEKNIEDNYCGYSSTGNYYLLRKHLKNY